MLKFFLNPDNSAYLRGLENEFGESSNAIRLELNRLEKAGMLGSSNQGNKKLFKVNRTHPLYDEINSIVRKFLGLDVIIEHITQKLGDVKAVYLTGKLAQGIDDDIIDLIFVGDIDRKYLNAIVEKTENIIKRKIRYLVYGIKEVEQKTFPTSDNLLIWQA